MMRLLKFFIYTLLTILLLIIILLYWQKDNIVEAAVRYAEKEFNIEVNYESTELELFKNWPKVGFEINEVSVQTKPFTDSIEFFEAKNLGISLSLWNIWGSPYQIDQVYLDRPKINLVCDSTGICNFDSFLTTNKNESQSTSIGSSVEFTLESLQWNEATVKYSTPDNPEILISGWTSNWFIAFLEDQLTIEMNISKSNISALDSGDPIFPQINLTAKGKFFYSISNESLTFENHRYTLNGLELNGEGHLNDIFTTPRIDWEIVMPSNSIESLIALFPTAYNSYADGIQTKGSATFQASIDGIFDVDSSNYPAIFASLNIQDGYVKYREANDPVDDLNISLNINKNQGDISDLEVLVERLKGGFGKSGEIDHTMRLFPFSKTKTNNGISQLEFNLTDLESTFPFYPKNTATGNLLLNGQYSFKMQDILNENWSQVNIEGTLTAEAIKYLLANGREVSLTKMRTSFDNKMVKINAEDLTYEQSLISFFDFDGAVLPYLLGTNKIIEGDLNIKSKFIDLNSLYAISDNSKEMAANSTRVSLPLTELSIFFESDELLYEDFDFSGVKVEGKLNDDKFRLNNVEAFYSSTFVQCSGDLANIENYLNASGDLLTSFDCTADEFDLLAYMNDEDQLTNDTAKSVEVFRFPELITMELKYNVNSITYDKIIFDDVIGDLGLKNQELTIKPTRMKSLGGEMSLKGMVKHKANDKLHYNFDLATNNSKFKTAFNSIEMVEAIAPVFKYMFGEFNTQVAIDGDIGKDLAPIYSSISAQGLLETINAQINNSEIFKKLDGLFEGEILKSITFPRTKNWFSIENGVVFLDPTTLILGKEDFIIEGSHQIDGEMDYTLSGPISLKQLKNSSLGREVWNTVNATIQRLGFPELPPDSKLEVEVELKGQMNDPSVKILPIKELQQQLKSILEKRKKEVKTELSDQIQEEKEKLDSLKNQKTEQAKKEVTREIKSLLDSGTTTTRIDSLREEAKRKTEKVKKKFKKWNPFGNE